MHLSHTIVEYETRFMQLGCYRPQYYVDFPDQRKRVSLFSGHPKCITQLLNLGTVSFTQIKQCKSRN